MNALQSISKGIKPDPETGLSRVAKLNHLSVDPNTGVVSGMIRIQQISLSGKPIPVLETQVPFSFNPEEKTADENPIPTDNAAIAQAVIDALITTKAAENAVNHYLLNENLTQ